MRVLKGGIDLPEFFRGLAGAKSRLLVLDYDGTLAPFQVQRQHAYPYPGVRDLLQAIHRTGQTRLVLISGRSVESLRQVLGLHPAPELWGVHGWQRRRPDGRVEHRQPPLLAQRGLERAVSAARQWSASRGEPWERRWEEKAASLAAHWRGLKPGAARLLREATEPLWKELAGLYGLQVHAFDGGLELRIPGQDKGTAIRTLLAEQGAGAAAAFLGDDLTDEDGFAAMASHGLGVLVRREWRPTAAGLWLKPPRELLRFLGDWRVSCPMTGPSAPPNAGS